MITQPPKHRLKRTKENRQREQNHAQPPQLKQPRPDIVVCFSGSRERERGYQYDCFATRAKTLSSFSNNNTGRSAHTFDEWEDGQEREERASQVRIKKYKKVWVVM